MRLVTAAEMREIEKAANESGYTFGDMMERAGEAVALVVRDRLCQGSEPGGPRPHILVLVGPGNNGGDGLVASRCLHEWGYAVSAYIWKRAVDRDTNLARAKDLGLPIAWSQQDASFETLSAWAQGSHVVVDALLGTGAAGPLRDDLRGLLSVVRGAVSASRATPRAGTGSLHSLMALADPAPPAPGTRVVAVDLPSGLDADTGAIDPAALSADLTVTFGFPKRGHLLFPGASFVGELIIADIGIPASIAAQPSATLDSTCVATSDEVARLLPHRPLNAHKGTFGSALIVAGSANYVGAPRLAAEAAYRIGTGLATLAVPQAIYPITARFTEATYVILPDELGAIAAGAVRVLAQRLRDYRALLVGPGLGREKTTGEFLWDLLSGHEHASRGSVGFVPQEESRSAYTLPPLVLDADALNLLSERPNWWERLPPGTVLTPHPGEMARLAGLDTRAVEEDRIQVARSHAQRWSCSIALKGAYTVVAAESGQVMVVPFAVPGLATAGSGDVLAGTIVGLMAQGLVGFDAAVCGAYIHALAGQLRAKQIGASGFLASDLLPLLPDAMHRLRREANRQDHNPNKGRGCAAPSNPNPP